MAYVSLPASSNVAKPNPWPALRLFTRETGRKLYSVEDLIYLQAVGNYSWLHWANSKRMLMPRTLKFYSPQLPPELFIRLHRHYLVNRRFIVRMERTETGGLAHLSTGEEIPISRRRWITAQHELRELAQQMD